VVGVTLTNHRRVLLFNPRLIVRVVGPRPLTGDGLFLAVSRQRIVDECASIVRVHPRLTTEVVLGSGPFLR